MNTEQAYKRILRARSKMLPCPFCGRMPDVSYSIQKTTPESFIHLIRIDSCCAIRGCGASDLFFGCKINLSGWVRMSLHFINKWNTRTTAQPGSWQDSYNRQKLNISRKG